MSKEIERKFLVVGDFKIHATKAIQIRQSYICTQPKHNVRIRITNDKGFVTIKGKSNGTGISRFEWEYEISLKDANELLELCEPTIINKTRYIVPSENHFFEIDEFHDANEGLIIAEIELTSEDEQFYRPDWLGKEVTGENKYYNSMLSKNPYTCWNDK